jgi:multimeric flavodoxin WrbA
VQPRIVGIISSPSRNGSTSMLVREALQAAAQSGADVDEIFLPALQLRTCTGCLHCMTEGGCTLPDDFEQIRARLCACDGIVSSERGRGIEGPRLST